MYDIIDNNMSFVRSLCCNLRFFDLCDFGIDNVNYKAIRIGKDSQGVRFSFLCILGRKCPFFVAESQLQTSRPKKVHVGNGTRQWPRPQTKRNETNADSGKGMGGGNRQDSTKASQGYEL